MKSIVSEYLEEIESFINGNERLLQAGIKAVATSRKDYITRIKEAFALRKGIVAAVCAPVVKNAGAGAFDVDLRIAASEIVGLRKDDWTAMDGAIAIARELENSPYDTGFDKIEESYDDSTGVLTATVFFYTTRISA